MPQQKIIISNMTCNKCKTLIETNVGVLEGVGSIEVFREDGYAMVTLITDTPELKLKIINEIESLVNGKFKAHFEGKKRGHLF